MSTACIYRPTAAATWGPSGKHYTTSGKKGLQQFDAWNSTHMVSSAPQFSVASSVQVARALFDPPPFQPEKLRIQFAPGTSQLEPAPPLRRYTLTHNDVTGDLSLTIGSDYNHKQISGFYTRLLRDEVTAEWKHSGPSYALHVYCHVSGEERWLAPPMLRNYIFRREMPLVSCVQASASVWRAVLLSTYAEFPIFTAIDVISASTHTMLLWCCCRFWTRFCMLMRSYSKATPT